MYREEIVGAWDRTAKLSQIKGKLEKELGIAINDDKIKYIMKMQKEQQQLGETNSVKKRYQPTTQALMENQN